MLDYKRSHTRDITTLTWYCKTSTSYKEYTWVQNTIHVTLYTHHVHDIVRNCDKPGNEGQLIFDFFFEKFVWIRDVSLTLAERVYMYY